MKKKKKNHKTTLSHIRSEVPKINKEKTIKAAKGKKVRLEEQNPMAADFSVETLQAGRWRDDIYIEKETVDLVFYAQQKLTFKNDSQKKKTTPSPTPDIYKLEEFIASTSAH